MTKLLLATRNAKKLGELRRIVAAEGLSGLEVIGLADVPSFPEAPETAPDFEGNAVAKARDAVAATGLPAIADDSGIAVDALNGMPGVLSARWSGPPKDDDRNNRLLLEQLADVPDERRGAHFTCSVAFVHDGGELVVRGRMDGRVIREVRGSGGFGYDVVFEADEHPGVTTAELSREDKDAISHRGKALRELAPLVAGVLG